MAWFKKRINTQAEGALGESKALHFLQQQGLRLIAQNWRCKGGEIDLVMHDGLTTVFIEVRQRKNAAFGGALASLSAKKQQSMRHAAAMYLVSHEITGACRIDALLFEGDEAPVWLKNILD
ncbi:MAG: YraN family protein [Neisseriaceae bacterium]|nr:YraN family protein [Neisseriaceae bacterium]